MSMIENSLSIVKKVTPTHWPCDIIKMEEHRLSSVIPLPNVAGLVLFSAAIDKWYNVGLTGILVRLVLASLLTWVGIK